MELVSYFSDFLRSIRPTESQQDDFRKGHATLRQRLRDDRGCGAIVVSTFLQGSYRRATAVKPSTEATADVDVVVVTSLSRGDYTPAKALKRFLPFLDKHYRGKYRVQGRSLGITLSYVDLDLVVTAAPSEEQPEVYKADSITADTDLEAAGDWKLNEFWTPPEARAHVARETVQLAEKHSEWKLSPLYIPDREAQKWVATHPLEQLRWSRDKNKLCNGHYVNVVKAIKWWRRVRHPESDALSSYPLERIVGDCCPDGTTSVADGVTRTLGSMVALFEIEAASEQVPVLPDHGVPENNVLQRISGEDFAVFYEQATTAAAVARQALDSQTVRESAEKWRELFGDEFPEPPSNGGDDDTSGPKRGGYTERTEESTVVTSRFA